MPYCKNCGKEVQDEDLYCPKCGTPQREPGEEIIVDEITIPFTEEETELDLRIAVSRHLRISPGAEKLVEGTIEYDDPELKPQVTTSGGRVTIWQDDRYFRRHWGAPRNNWDLKLGTEKPYKLRVKTGVSQADFELGGLPLIDVDIETGVGQNIVSFSDPNPEKMRRLKINTSVGDTKLDDLLNAGFTEMRLDGGVGQVKMSFTGENLKEDARVRVEGGVGGLVIEVKEGLAASFTVNGLTTVGTHGAIRTRYKNFGKGAFYTDAYMAENEPKLEFTISLGLGGVTLRTI
ncbi:MAG: zinc-ribbon domain-containing protein [Candidatus Bathyarchaeota archaeon]|nr:zinc-ribbon domain-containing protein [Candidatus Bathyarchaeota archaeon]